MTPSLSMTLTIAILAGSFVGSTGLAGPRVQPIDPAVGGTFCFSFQQPRLAEWRETFKLAMRPVSPDTVGDRESFDDRRTWLPARHRARPDAGFMSVDGLQHGILTGPTPMEYISVQTGTAAPDLAGTGLLVSLTSNESGLGLDQTTPGLWIANIAMTLDIRDLSGTALGYKQFWPIANGMVGSPMTESVDGVLTPISCAEF